MDQQTQFDIEQLLNIAIDEMKAANATGDSELFVKLGDKYGPIAHRVYSQLDSISRKSSCFYGDSFRPILLDPWTVLNRARTYGIRDSHITLASLEFWLHADMVKALTDYLIIAYPNMRKAYACAIGP